MSSFCMDDGIGGGMDMGGMMNGTDTDGNTKDSAGFATFAPIVTVALVTLIFV
jgi:hypothetical protein